MLTMRWRCLLLIIATMFLITFADPVLAVFKSSALKTNNDSINAVFIADNSSATEQKHSYNLLQQLNLTTQQQEQIKQIHYKYKQEIRKKKNDLAVLQQQLSDLMVGTQSAELIRAKNQQLVNLRQEIGKLRFETMLATREILTPQQRQKFKTIIESQIAQ